MAQDRGTIKWTTLMLPEHAALLKELWDEDKKVRKPQLDLQEIERMNQQLLEAYERQLTVALLVHENGSEIVHSGKIGRMDKNKKCLTIHEKDHTEIKVPFHSVIRLTID